MAQRVLVAEDDPTVAEVVVSYLRNAGYEVEHVGDGELALRAITGASPDAVILDRMLPGMDGLELCRRLRADPATLRVPVIMLTALGDENDRLHGLETGADDYVTKPFSPRELVLRVRSVLRRSGEAGTGARVPAADGPLCIDPVRHEASLDGEPLSLTGREFDLLLHFVTHEGTAFSRTQLLREVWGWSFGDESTVTVHVRRLREKIEDDPSEPRRLLTVWGVGYRWRRWQEAST